MHRRAKAWLRGLLPKGVRDHRILRGPLRGHTIVTSWHDYPAAILGYTERPLLDWFARNVRAGETWLDVGAHYGYTAMGLCRLVGPAGRVFAFEPAASTAGYVTQTRRLNNLAQLAVVPLGLACPETLEVTYLPTTRGMVDSTLAGREDATQWQETVLVARLDWLWPRLCQGRPELHGVKIDVQGMELATVDGMAELLRAQQPKLIVEVHAGVDRRQLLSRLQALGYGPGATPVEPAAGEAEPAYLDNRSYYFAPASGP